MTPAADFIRASTRVEAPPLVPEVRLHLADDVFGFWERIEATRGPAESPMPFWAFAWPGGQALARYLLDHPDVVAGRDVFDLASGSGIVAVAAAKAGARSVTACEIDPLAICAIDLNARLNGGGVVAFQTDVADVEIEAAEVALAGDVFYDRVL